MKNPEMKALSLLKTILENTESPVDKIDTLLASGDIEPEDIVACGFGNDLRSYYDENGSYILGCDLKEKIRAALGIPEPNEPPKKKYTVHVREVWEGDFEVEAEDDDEAYELACDLEYDSVDLDYTDREVYVDEADKTE